jgi:hypothetical protein
MISGRLPMEGCHPALDNAMSIVACAVRGHVRVASVLGRALVQRRTAPCRCSPAMRDAM